MREAVLLIRVPMTPGDESRTGARSTATSQHGHAVAADRVPLVVDLDGTLLRTESSIEAVLVLAHKSPLALFKLPAWLIKGRAYLKQRIAQLATPDVRTLPYRDDLLAFLRDQKQSGRVLVLATAADERLAQKIAGKVALFDAVLASDGTVNLAGERKRERLVAEFGERGFDYIGNSRQDLPVWRSARQALLVSPSRRLGRDVATVTSVARTFDERAARWTDYLQAMRLHHWVKNGLIFVPLAIAHRLLDLSLWGPALLGFVSFSLCASSIYVLNDLLDLRSDRKHPHKKERQFAAGQLPLAHALALLPVLLTSAFLLGARLPAPFPGVLGLYFSLMLAYSFRLKDVPIADVVTLASGYALRVAAGFVIVGMRPSAWLLAMCVFLFFSLALVKRYAELVILQSVTRTRSVRARGYRRRDEVIIVVQGIASGYLAVLVLALYANTQINDHFQARHEIFWLPCFLLFCWISYMWLMAARGRMHHDPVVFALKDRLSLWMLLAMGAVAVLAI